MDRAIRDGKRVVFLDERHTTNRPQQKFERSRSNQNIKIIEQEMLTKPLHLLAAVSAEQGLEAYIVFEEHINS